MESINIQKKIKKNIKNYNFLRIAYYSGAVKPTKGKASAKS